jgi:2-oxoisovalerate dehydrogenase E1 component beta subunit
MKRHAAADVLEAADKAVAQAEPDGSRARRWLMAGDPPHPTTQAIRRPRVIAGADRLEPARSAAHPDGLTMVEALKRALDEEMSLDSSVVLLGEDVGRKGGVFKVTEGLLERFGPLRVMDTPMAEIVIAGAAIGAAMMGLRPVAEFQFADYIHPAYDQVVNQAATMRWRTVGAYGVPAVFRAPFGAGIQGGIYHSQSVEALYCHIPGLKVVVPATPADAYGLLKAAIRDDDPVLFFEHKRSYRRYRETIPEAQAIVPIGQARLDREGTTLSVVTYGVGVHLAREAAEVLALEGISIEILDLRTLAPFDREAVARTVRKTGKLLILHEANKTMGIGAELSAFAAEELFLDLDGPITRVAAADCHLPYNSAEESAIIPGVPSVVEAARRLAAF